MISIQGLTFRYSGAGFRLAIDNMSVNKGEKVALIGPSGSGKTTLLNLLAGILVPDSGRVDVNGVGISGTADSARRDFRIRNIGFVFQDFGLIDFLDVHDNILHPYRITRSLKLTETIRHKGADLAHTMGIGDKLKSYPADLSQGERQRVAICRALLTEPRLILADEATGNLDPVTKVQILDLLFSAIAESNATLFAVTHDKELLPYFDRVLDSQHFLEAGPI